MGFGFCFLNNCEFLGKGESISSCPSDCVDDSAFKLSSVPLQFDYSFRSSQPLKLSLVLFVCGSAGLMIGLLVFLFVRKQVGK